ncbi:fibrinogen-like protein 1 [Mytilus edulis]|uniref:fibrinogen-like protein 1 n=1 Tax=Mytilus edulis TaxID=6550 RepID=UPI0039F0BEB4
MIISSATSMEIRKVKSRIVCAGLCVSSSSCCSVSYDVQTSECLMDSNCFPDSASSQYGTFLRKPPYVPTNNQSVSFVTTTKYELSFETTKRDITTSDSTSSKTESTNTNNETGDNSNNGSDDTIEFTSITTTDNGPTGNSVDCSAVSRNSPSGVYTIYVADQVIDVYCEMTDNGQWTVIQKRLNGTTHFNRNWQEYKQGFGDVQVEYWLGNDNLHQMLSTKNYKLRIDLEDWNGVTKYAEYDSFIVGNETTNYILTISGYNGDAGDSIINPPSGQIYHNMNGMEFSTFDKDNEEAHYNAAEIKQSGWWFKWSTDANLNGLYYTGGQTASDGIYWNSWQLSFYSLKSVSMKIKPS